MRHLRYATCAGLRPLAGLLALGLLLAVPLACAPAEEEAPGTTPPAEEAGAAAAPNTLTAAEEAAGWQLLFDGETFAGWRGLGRDGVPEGHWIIEDGMIRKVASGDVPVQADGQPLEGGDLMTEATYDDYELMFEWKVAPGANSGVKYNVSEEMSTANPPGHAALGFEYQVLDDAQHPDAQNGPNRTAGALYDLIPPDPGAKQLQSVGAFNEARIVFRGGHGEHWLNGQKVVEYDLGTARFDSLLAASKYASVAGFADKRSGHIVLQDHGDDVWFRNIKIRPLPAQ
jgi:hypothetical protein